MVQDLSPPCRVPPNLREIDTETPKSVPEGVREGHPRSSLATTTRELNMGWGLRLLVYGPPHNPQLSVGGGGGLRLQSVAEVDRGGGGEGLSKPPQDRLLISGLGDLGTGFRSSDPSVSLPDAGT